MPEKLTEYQLVEKFIQAKRKRDELKDAAAAAQNEFDAIEGQLIESLNEQDKTATAHYDGIGYIGMVKPRVCASYEVGQKETVLGFLRQINRSDLITEIVHPSTLSAFVKEQLETGNALPTCISYYLKSSARFYPAKGGSDV